MANMFGTPSTGATGAPSDNPVDDDFADCGLSEDTPPAVPLGIFDAICKGPKKIKSENYDGFCLEFELQDPSYMGETVGILAPTITPDMSAKKRKSAVGQWRRLGEVCRVMGLTVNPKSQRPDDGWAATIGLSCRIAVNEYNGRASVVRFRPGPSEFPAEYAVDGRHRDYGCGVLPMPE